MLQGPPSEAANRGTPYRDPAGREKARVFNRREDAQRFSTEVEDNKLRGTWTDPAFARVLFRDWLAKW